MIVPEQEYIAFGSLCLDFILLSQAISEKVKFFYSPPGAIELLT